MNILITGGSGFVGKNLSGFLTDSNISYEFLNRNDLQVTSLTFEENITGIIHLAGKAHDMNSTIDPCAYYNINYELTKKLYTAFLKSNAKIFIFISSVKASADLVEGVLTEADIPNPQTDYGKSKLMAEEFILLAPISESKSFFILRPCMIHGPGNKGNLSLLYKFIKIGMPYPLAAFNNKRSFLSVENLCFVIKELLLQIDIPSGIYNIADDEALSTNEVITLLAQSIGKKPKLLFISKSFIFKLAAIGDKLRFPLTTERLNKLTENYIVSNKKIKSTLNIQLPIQSRDGIIITANSFQNE